MKSLINKTMFVFEVLIALLFINQAVYAQSHLTDTLPVDSKVKIGHFDNGFTYYLRENSKPENRVEIRLVVKAGSVLEDDDQQGLAHFVEHMAFNGTKNFEKNELVKYMQSVGVQFGPEVNAGTGLNETTYMLTLPTDSVHILDKGFQVMEDWAHSITFGTAEIDKERGVIKEEWRLRQGISQRLQDELVPLILGGSKYENRLPIGKMEIVENAPYQALTRFYNDWYRPDLMAIIIVGDMDADVMEQYVIKHFSNLKNPTNPRVRPTYPVPGTDGIQTLVFADKEMPIAQTELIFKIDPQEEVLLKDYRRSLVNQFITSVLGDRFNELREQSDPPFVMAQAVYSSMVPEKDLMEIAAAMQANGIDRGITALVTECERAVRYGFTEGEVSRKKKEILTMYEKAYNEREKTNSVNYAAEYQRNFTINEPIPGIEFEYNFVKEYLGGITVEEINDQLKEYFRMDQMITLIAAPEKEDLELPDHAQVVEMIETAASGEILPYEDKLAGESLISEIPQKGRIILTKKNNGLGIVEMKLSNGAKVILKPTDFKNDEVLFSAYSPGGYSIYDLGDYQSAYFADDMVLQCGVDDFSPSDINKILAGKNVSVSSYISAYYEGVSGTSTPRDIESMFQLAYLYMTKPRPDSAIFKSVMDLQKEYIKNALSTPETYFQDQFTRARTQNNPRAGYIPTEEEMNTVDMKRLFEIYNDRFADISDFTFFLVGSFDIDSIKPFIEMYLASLPSLKRDESWEDMGIRPPEEKTEKLIYKGNDPKSRVGIYFESPESWDLQEAHIFESLGQLLNIRYLEILREEMSGVYNFGVSVNLVRIPYSHMAVNIIIPCSPDNTDALTKAAIDEIARIQKEGVTEDYMTKVKEAQRRELEKNLKENRYWLSQLISVYKINDPSLITDFNNRIESLTSDDLKEAALQINLDNYVRVVLYPESSEK